MKNKFKIYTLGCKVNQYDSAILSYLLRRAGFESTHKNAQCAIVNTCCVTKTAIHKDKRMINKVRSENPKAKIILMGCWPAVYGEEARRAGVDLVWGVGEHEKLVKKIKNEFFKEDILSPCPKVTGGIVCDDKSRYFLKIQDGCEQFCSYCIIPYARGKMKSRPTGEIIKEVGQAADHGYGEIILSGIHLGKYKTKNKKDLIYLLNKIIEISKLGRIRLSSIEINEVTDGLINLIKNSDGKICRHLHIPLQSGSDKILKLMNRPYNKKYYADKIKKIREAMPDIAITTDVIVGFPGETEKEFKKTYDLVKEINFSRLHAFPFSAHEKTPAFKMENQASKEIMKKRTEKLKKLGYRLAVGYRKKFKGRDLKVVIEQIHEGVARCKTEYYFDIMVNTKKFGKTRPQISKIEKIRH